MIITRLMGGLGNQMFQYAFGRMLSIRHQTELKTDLSFLLNRNKSFTHTLRNYDLHAFNIQSSAVNSSPCSESGIRSKVRSIFGKTMHQVTEKHFPFDDEAYHAPDNTCLAGYWQSEKYFKQIRDELLNELQPIRPMDDQNLGVANEISSCESISVHVRRGDFIHNPTASVVHGFPGISYYEKAIDLIAHTNSSVKIFIFSDDINWVKEHIKTDLPCIYIDHNNGDKSYEDIRLMSLCRHNIIANSSFSWWGAWLNQHKDKKVIAPARWFLNDTDTRDLLPPNWIKL
jgi:hypothetical protein